MEAGSRVVLRERAEAPGIYVHKDGTASKSENYVRFVDFCVDQVGGHGRLGPQSPAPREHGPVDP